MKLFNVSQEAKEIEVERTFYAYVNDFKQLEKASSKQFIWQSEIMNDVNSPMEKFSGIIRVRNYDNSKYELTVKKSLGAEVGSKNIETNTSIDKDMFENFLKVAPISYKKTRFKFKGKEGTWDVDALWGQDGKFIPWLKMDYESTKGLFDEPDFPIEVITWFEVKHPGSVAGENTPKQKELLAKLFQELCLIDNETGIRSINLKQDKQTTLDINNLALFV